MVMTKEDICREYRLAANKVGKVKILADMNLCTKQQIADILIEDGQEVPKWYRKKTKEEVPKEVPEEEDVESSEAEPKEKPKEEPKRAPKQNDDVFRLQADRIRELEEEVKTLTKKLECEQRAHSVELDELSRAFNILEEHNKKLQKTVCMMAAEIYGG